MEIAQGPASPTLSGGALVGEAIDQNDGRQHERDHQAANGGRGTGAADVVVGDDAAGEGEAGNATVDFDRVHNDTRGGYFLNETVNDPTYPPSKALTAEDYYNPRNLTLAELEMVIYEWEEEAKPVKEYIDTRVIHQIRTGEYDDDWRWEEEEEEEESEGWASRLKKWVTRDDGSRKMVNGSAIDDGSNATVEIKKGSIKYLNLTDDVAHVVEFYASWCPHCQAYKWEYIELAAEVQRRSITPVEFHAVSCDMHYIVCATYKIGGFPVLLGWKPGESKAKAGVRLNPNKWKARADKIGDMLGLDLAHEEVDLIEWDLDDELQATHDLKKIEGGRKAATMKTSWHEHAPHTRNDRYHNAALSLAFAVKTQAFQTSTDDGKMDPKRKRALIDFLNLLDWASPQSWELRTGLFKRLQSKVGANKVKDRKGVESLIDEDMDRHRSSGSKMLWGFVDVDEGGWAGLILSQKQEELAKKDKLWTNACTHSQPAKGFTCGLWNLFHILTIGSSKKEHELYGFHSGYSVSPHHVAETIRNFVEYYLSCDVCRDHFLEMYDGCGHGHCNRLKSENLTGSTDEYSPPTTELALWLWEVHNSVNERLMKEAAQRQNRKVTHQETLASRFPTKKMCPDCWLDANMTTWDNAQVFSFLDDWFWPEYEPSDEQFMAVIAGTAEVKEGLPAGSDGGVGGSSNVRAKRSSPVSLSRPGTWSISLFCGLSLSLLGVLIMIRKNIQEKKRRRDWGKKHP